MPDHQSVKKLFNAAAPRYNFVNSVLSFGQDAPWRKKVAKAVASTRAIDILDVATGSGVLAFAIARHYALANIPCSITGVDFSEELLKIAKRDLLKISDKDPFPFSVHFRLGDALAVPFDDNSFDALTVAFGLRNFQSREKFYTEALRVLRPGGHLFVLEFSQPTGLMRPLYHIYDTLLPYIAQALGQKKEHYTYLKDTIRAWPNAPALATELAHHGFISPCFQRLTGGIVALHTAQKAT